MQLYLYPSISIDNEVSILDYVSLKPIASPLNRLLYSHPVECKCVPEDTI